MNQVWKYPLPEEALFTLRLPVQSAPLCVRWINAIPCLYVRVVDQGLGTDFFTFQIETNLQNQNQEVSILQPDKGTKNFILTYSPPITQEWVAHLTAIEIPLRGAFNLDLPTGTEFKYLGKVDNETPILYVSLGVGPTKKYRFAMVNTGEEFPLFTEHIDTIAFLVINRDFVKHLFKF